MKVAVVVPAYEAAHSIARVIQDLVRAFPSTSTLFVVDDGSTDGTADVARASGATVIVHDRNRGKGVALRTGLHAAADAGFVAAVSVDADGQHPAAEAWRVASETADPEAYVLGVRDLASAGAPRANRISNGISNGFLSLFSRRLLADTQCGLRRYPLPRALEIGGRDHGYAFEAEMILLAIAADIPIVQVPVRVLYPPDRTTHFHSVRDPARVILRVLRTLFATRGITRPPRGA